MLILHAVREGVEKGGWQETFMPENERHHFSPSSLCYGRNSREDYGPYSAGVLLLYASKYSFTFQRLYFRFFDVGALLAWRFLYSSASLGPQWPVSQPVSALSPVVPLLRNCKFMAHLMRD